MVDSVKMVNARYLVSVTVKRMKNVLIWCVTRLVETIQIVNAIVMEYVLEEEMKLKSVVKQVVLLDITVMLQVESVIFLNVI